MADSDSVHRPIDGQSRGNLSHATQRKFGRFVTPLHRLAEDQSLIHEGSGVLISTPISNWLFTAAHLFDHTAVIFLFGARTTISLPREFFQGSTKLDILFTRVPQEYTEDILAGGLTFFPSDWVQNALKPPQIGECLFVGYPDKSIRIIPESRRIEARTTALRSFPLPVAEYGNFRLNKKFHIASRFEQFAEENTANPIPDFDPHGLSGGAILHGVPERGITLVGIATGYQKNVLIGSRFNEVVPELQRQVGKNRKTSS